jgi:hypothetical protein
MDYERYEMALKNFFFFQEGQAAGENPSWFDSMLYQLIWKADMVNLRRIEEGFPEHVAVFKDWQQAGDFGRDLFRKHGLMK